MQIRSGLLFFFADSETGERRPLPAGPVSRQKRNSFRVLEPSHQNIFPAQVRARVSFHFTQSSPRLKFRGLVCVGQSSSECGWAGEMAGAMFFLIGRGSQLSIGSVEQFVANQ